MLAMPASNQCEENPIVLSMVKIGPTSPKDFVHEISLQLPFGSTRAMIKGPDFPMVPKSSSMRPTVVSAASIVQSGQDWSDIVVVAKDMYDVEVPHHLVTECLYRDYTVEDFDRWGYTHLIVVAPLKSGLGDSAEMRCFAIRTVTEKDQVTKKTKRFLESYSLSIAELNHLNMQDCGLVFAQGEGA